MRQQVRWVFLVALLPATLLLSGCLFNAFQAARTIGAGNIGLAVGSGIMEIGLEGDPIWTLTPQARLSYGLGDRAEFGLQSGAMIPLATGDVGWMGAQADLKFSVIDEPGALALAVGFGAGIGLEFVGWGVFGEVLLDASPIGFPLFFAYKPKVPVGGAGLALWHQVTGGLSLRLSERANLLLRVDVQWPLVSFGVALEFGPRQGVGEPSDPAEF